MSAFGGKADIPKADSAGAPASERFFTASPLISTGGGIRKKGYACGRGAAPLDKP